MSFLDIKISHKNNKFMTSVDRKPTFSGIFTNFESFIQDIYKRELIQTFLFRLSANYENFHREIETLRPILKRNIHPQNLVHHCSKKFLNDLFI